MNVRKALTGAALAAVTAFGLTVPVAAPAAAASCSEVQSVRGTAEYVYRGTDVEVSPTLVIGVANCSGIHYRYSVYVFEDYKIYGSSSVSGSNGFGTASAPTITTSGLEVGNSKVGLGVKVEFRNWSTGQWETRYKHAWYIQMPGSFDTATGQNVSAYPYSTGYNGGCTSYAYGSPCLPF